MNELRCSHCGRLLAKAMVNNGYIEIKCSKCGEINKFKYFNEEEPHEMHEESDK